VNTRGIVITAWLAAGHAILGALYWLLLQVPESNLLMLAASVAVIAVMILWAGLVETAGLLGWAHGAQAAGVFAASLRRAAWILPSLILFTLVWLVTSVAGNWLAAHRGEIDAWFIARAGWTNVEWFHTTTAWALWFVRYVCGVSMATALLAAVVKDGVGEIGRSAWFRHAFSWRTLVIVTGALLVGAWLPWTYVVDWRPASLPVSWVQPAFAAVKLGLVFIVMNTAWAVVLRRAARG